MNEPNENPCAPCPAGGEAPAAPPEIAPSEATEMAPPKVPNGPTDEAPPAEPTPRAEMSPAEVMERVRKGELIQNARVERLRFRGEFDRPVRFRNCTLVKPNFDGATFKEDVTFSNCTLDRPVFNRKTVCEKGLDLGYATLNRPVVRDLTVRGRVNAIRLKVCGKFQLVNCRFEGQFFAWEAYFSEWADLKGCAFLGEVDLRSTHFDQGLVFTNKCSFAGPVLLRGASVAKKFDAGDAHFEGMLDLSKAKLHDFVYLENIGQGEGQRFAFWNALAERIRVRPEQLAGRVKSEEERDYHKAMQEYGLLKRCFQTLHLYDEEDWAFYRFKVCQRRGCGRSWKRPWTKVGQFFDWLLLDVGCGYGASPLRAVRAAAVIIVLFALVYAAGFDQFHVDHLPFDGEARDSAGNRVMHGLLTSVSVFTSGGSEVRDLAKGWMNVPLILEAMLGILLFGLFIVAFSRKVIR